MRFRGCVLSILALLAPCQIEGDQEFDLYSRAVVLWQASEPTCFEAARPLREQMETVDQFSVDGKIPEPRKIKGDVPFSDAFAGIKIVPGVPVMELVINGEGHIESVVSLRPVSPEFDARIGELLKTWIFEPVAVNSKPMCVRYIMTIHITWQ